MAPRGFTRVLLFLFGGLAVAVLALFVLLQTPWMRNYLRGIAERRAAAALGADVSIGALRGNLLSHAELIDLRITSNGRPVIAVPETDVSYTVPALLSGGIDVAQVTLRQPTIHLWRSDQGALNLAALGRAPSADKRTQVPASGEPGRGWSVDDIRIQDGTLSIGDEVVTTGAVNVPERLVNIDGHFTVGSRREGGVRLGIDALSFQIAGPGLRVQQAEGVLVLAPDVLQFDELAIDTSAGTIAVDGAITNRQSTPTYGLEISAQDLRFAALQPMVPALKGFELSPTADATLKGPPDQLQARFNVRMQPGTVSGDVTLDITAPDRRVTGTIETRGLNLAGLKLGNLTDLTLQADVDLEIPKGGLEGLSGTYQVTAPAIRYGKYDAEHLDASGRVNGRTIRVDEARAAIYGGTLQTEGTITLPANGEPIEYNLDGRLRDVDPSQLPEDLRPPGVAGRSGRVRRSPAPGVLHAAWFASRAPRHRSVDAAFHRHAAFRPPEAATLARVVRAAPAAALQEDQGIDLDFQLKGRGSDIEADVELLDVSIAGADFARGTDVDVSRRGGRLHYSAKGAVTGLNLRRLGRELGLDALAAERFDSQVDATFDITGSGTELTTLTLRGTATLTGSELLGMSVPQLFVRPDLTRGSGTVAVDGTFQRLDVGALSGRPSLESRLQGTVDARLTLDSLADPDFSLGALEARGRLTLADSTFSGVRVDQAVIEATLSESMARIEELTIRGPDLGVEANGTLALDRTGTSALRYLIDTPALQQLEALGRGPAKGDVRITGTISGNLAQLQTEGTLSGTRVGYGETTALSIHSTYDVVVPDLDMSRARISAVTEVSELEAAGRSFAAVSARTEYRDRTLEAAAKVKDVEQTLTAEGRVVWHPDHQEVLLRALQLDAPDAVWTLASDGGATVRYAGKTIEVADLVLATAAGGRISIDGTLGAAGQVLHASVRDLQLDAIDDLILEEEPLAGLVQATASISGSFSQPIVDADVAVTDGAYRGFEYQRAAAAIAYGPHLVRVDGQIVQSEGVTFTAKGTIPLSKDAAEKLHLRIESTPVNLALAQTFTDELRDVGGTAEMDVTVTGSLTKPLLEGSLHVRGGAFTVVLAQSRYSGLDTELTFDRDRVRIREFVMADDEGNRLRIGGQLPLVAGDAPDVNVRIVSENFELADNRLLELNADTNLLVTGALLHPRIEGRVGIGESLVRVDRILQLTSGAYEVAPAETPSPDPEEPGVFEPTLDITLAIPDSLIVRGTDLRSPGGGPIGLGNVNITIGGELQIRKQPGEDLTVLGEVQTVRGSYEFQGRQFTIQRDGRIFFMGTPDLNPRLDIRAEREISGVVAAVRIGGVLEKPELTLSSQPPMEDAEVLSLIVFNQPLSLLGTGAQISLATRATALASGFLASRLTESIGNALELDVFEIEAGTADGALTPALTLGEQFGNLWIRLRQRFGPEAVSQAIVEYRLAEWLQLQTAYSQGDARATSLLRRLEQAGIDLLFFFSY